VTLKELPERLIWIPYLKEALELTWQDDNLTNAKHNKLSSKEIADMLEDEKRKIKELIDKKSKDTMMAKMIESEDLASAK
jgi:hypothetical protein